MSEQLKKWYRLRGALIVPFYLFVIICTYGEIENSLVTVPLGGTLFMAGLFLRVWAQVHLHYRLKVHKRLTLTGPYAYVRNPIYIGNTLIFLGVTVLAELLWFVPVMLAACAFTYHMTVKYEESHLAEKYGPGYVAFLQRVPRWIPRFGSARKDARRDFTEFLVPSIKAELYILILLSGPVFKELIF